MKNDKPDSDSLLHTALGENVVFLPAVLNETLMLLLESHQYFQEYGLSDQAQMNSRDRSFYCCEMSRITMRLSCVMAWLTVRKAVYSGKITHQESIEKFRLDCRDLCLHQNIEAESVLPPYMRQLLDRSFELYRRVGRLDEDLVSNPYAQQYRI